MESATFNYVQRAMSRLFFWTAFPHGMRNEFYLRSPIGLRGPFIASHRQNLVISYTGVAAHPVSSQVEC